MPSLLDLTLQETKKEELWRLSVDKMLVKTGSVLYRRIRNTFIRKITASFDRSVLFESTWMVKSKATHFKN